MDAKRLEELAAWAKAQEASLIANDITDVAGYYADLARCAAAWAKVERILSTDTDLELARCYGGEIRIRANDVQSAAWGPTAIAAVEAAPEVKP